MRKLARKWRNSGDDKFSLPIHDDEDSRPMDSQGFNFSAIRFPFRVSVLQLQFTRHHDPKFPTFKLCYISQFDYLDLYLDYRKNK